MSATSTVGRLILPFSVGGWAWCRGPKREERQWGYLHPANDVERGGGRWLLLPNRHDRAEPEWSSDRFHVLKGASPNYVEAGVEIPFSGSLHAGQLHARRATPFWNRSVARCESGTGWG